MKTHSRIPNQQAQDVAVFKKWLTSSEGTKAVQDSRAQAKEEAIKIESISLVEMQKLKEPFTLKP